MTVSLINTGTSTKRIYFEQVVLYSIFSFFLIAVLASKTGNYAYYISCSCSVFLIVGYIYMFFPQGAVKINLKILLLTILLVLFTTTSYLTTFDIYPAVFYLYLIAIIIFFRNADIGVEVFLKYFNTSYIIFLLLSVCQYSHILPQSREILNVFDIHIGTFTIKSLYGLGGSTAFIDSLSGLTLIINIFLNQSKSKYTYIAIACIAIIMTFRLTPIYAFGLSMFMGLCIKNRALAFWLILSIFFSWVIIMYLLFNNYQTVSLFGIDLFLDEIVYHYTHARSMIWKVQLEYLFNNYSFYEFLFGDFNSNFDLQLFSSSGYLIDKTSDNAHNSYLANFYRSPLLSILFVTLIPGAVLRNFNRRSFPVILFITTVAYTNATVFSIQNPLFILTLVYLLTNKNDLIMQIPTTMPITETGFRVSK